MEHLIINLIILWVGIGIWLGNCKINKEIRNHIPTYSDYLYRLHLITGKSEYDLFKVAAVEGGVAEYMVDDQFKLYVKDGTLPAYMTKFLDQGKEHIIKCKVKTWIW